MVETNFDQLYPAAKRLAAIRAATVVVLYGLSRNLRSDLEQEVLLELWTKYPLFDASRASWRTFAERVVANRMTSIIRYVRSARCGYRKEEPLSGTSRRLPAPDSCIALRIEVRRVLSRVAPFDREVARYLIDCSANDTGERLGVSRATVYRAIGRLREAFAEAGLSPLRRSPGCDAEQAGT